MAIDEQELLKQIAESKDVKGLGRVAAYHQYDSWYDPCGKSGETFNTRLSTISEACLRRIGKLIGMESGW